MGQKINPISNRLGYTKGWKSMWYASKKSLPAYLIEDRAVRELIKQKTASGIIAQITIERLLERLIVKIHTTRPGMLIGPGGEKIKALNGFLNKKINKKVKLEILEVRKQEANASWVSQEIKTQIEARRPHRRIMKRMIEGSMRCGIKGIKIVAKGRLNGIEIARKEEYKEGRIPLHTLRALVDYAEAVALTTYGKIGIKVWIFKGEVYERPNLTPNLASVGNQKPYSEDWITL